MKMRTTKHTRQIHNLWDKTQLYTDQECTHNMVRSKCIVLPRRDPAILDGLDLTEDERRELIDNINRRLTPQAVKIRAGNVAPPWIALSNLDLWHLRTPSHFIPPADIEVACYGYEGIDAVKDALRAGLNCSTEAMPIKVTHAPVQPSLPPRWGTC